MHICPGFLSGIKRYCSNLVLHCSTDRKPGGLALLLTELQAINIMQQTGSVQGTQTNAVNLALMTILQLTARQVNSRGGWGERQEPSEENRTEL